MNQAQWYKWPKKRQLYSQINGEGPGGQCVCPACGAKKPHIAGVPCTRIACPKCGAKMGREGVIINKAYSRTKCMRCDKPPQIDARWANGWGRAWFCIPHFLQWASEEAREIVRAWFIKDGQVPKSVKDHPGTVIRGQGERVSAQRIADRATNLAKGNRYHGR